MIDLRVNNILDFGEKGLQAYVFDNELIAHNMNFIFSTKDILKIREVVSNTGGIQLFNIYGRFINFLGLNQNQPAEGIQIFIDCKNNEDNAFDLFKEMKEHGIDETQRSMFMSQFYRLYPKYEEVEVNYRIIEI